ncbi:S8 family serine peptidase [Modicisalibacter luteus]|uniref:S8 family serine peptidase n=3 Tax=Modicisalibacter luteus TaxID=453962 RepID=A0ABV7M0P5_9GAMM|nr:S8 family serine peptidase [Halomonas lutea]GHA97131.1 hypothetical protein GCM10007159_18590 [Halomonas lutea]
MPRKPALWFLLLGATSFALTGCGGGGGGGSSSPPPPITKTPDIGDDSIDPDQGNEPPPPDQDSDTTGTPELHREPNYLSKDSVSVLVGIADSGFRTTHNSIAPYLVGTVNLATPDNPDVSTSSWHGTAVTSVVTTEPTSDTSLVGTSTNTGLLLAKVNEEDSLYAYTRVLDYSVGFLADEGARVINHSYSGRLNAPDATASYLDVKSIDSLQKIATSNGGLGSVYTVAAGNDGKAISSSNPIYQEQYRDIFERMLIVGASNGNQLAEYSNHPGANKDWQSRFLTAPGETLVAVDSADNTYGVGRGTSFAAPQVAAYAAAIIETWPHLDAKQVSKLLLDTAYKDPSPESLYNSNECGPNKDMNCGYFYLGQGKADLDEAMRPQGELAMPSGSTVQAGGYSLSDSTAQLSGAYGDELASSGVLNEVAMFDELGRDYQVDLSPHVVSQNERDDMTRKRMERMALVSGEHRDETYSELGGFGFMARYNGYGETTAARLDARFGRSHWSAYQYDGDEISPMSPFAESNIMPMLSFQGGSPLTQGLGHVSGITSRYSIGDKVSLIASHWAGQPGDQNASVLDSGYQANRSDIAMAFHFTDELSLTIGTGIAQEDNGLLGAQGTAAFSFGETNQINMQNARLNYQFAEQLSAFAFYEQGRGEMSGDGLIQNIKDIRTEEMAMGLQWEGEKHRAALTLRQPMRIDNANATLSVPVGRTLDGHVLREDRTVSLAASGQQRDVEFGYAFMPSESSQVQLNLLYSIQPGHNRKASNELASMLNYAYQF